jgi:hypothetical protein
MHQQTILSHPLVAFFFIILTMGKRKATEEPNLAESAGEPRCRI